MLKLITAANKKRHPTIGVALVEASTAITLLEFSAWNFPFEIPSLEPVSAELRALRLLDVAQRVDAQYLLP